MKFTVGMETVVRMESAVTMATLRIETSTWMTETHAPLLCISMTETHAPLLCISLYHNLVIFRCQKKFVVS